MAGFRIWNKRFQAVNVTTTGVTVEYENDGVTPTGRMLSNGEFIGYYPNTQTLDGEELSLGVRASLEDTCQPLVDPNVNGVGWELDYDLYTRLNTLSAYDLSYPEFKRRNPLLYTPSTPLLPNGNNAPKSVRLFPSQFLYCMFFKHTSGYKLMVGLSYTGLSVARDSYSINNYNKQDAGFLYNHIHSSCHSMTYQQYRTSIGMFIVSMIPPANEGEIQDDWHPELSIRDENFYAPSMFPIYAMASGQTNDNYNESSAYYNNGSWIRLGTSTTYDAGLNSGVLVGTSMKTSLLADSKGNVGLSYHYKANSNTQELNPIIFIGPIYKNKIYDSSRDRLPQRFISAWSYASLGNILNNEYNIRACAWCHTWNGTYINIASTIVTKSYIRLNSVDITNGNPSMEQIYTAYPALPSDVYTNYRYSKALYTTIGLIDEDVLRAVNQSGLISGQTFNNGSWCFINSFGIPELQDGTTASSLLSLVIRWDGDFNGIETFN